MEEKEKKKRKSKTAELTELRNSIPSKEKSTRDTKEYHMSAEVATLD